MMKNHFLTFNCNIRNLVNYSVILSILLIANMSELSALEISGVRLGQTKQLLRVVIDSDEPLMVDETWQSDSLTLVLKNSRYSIGTEIRYGYLN